MPKNIVLCCDGTWNRFERGKVTNIVRLCSCLVRHSASQVVYYDPGVGTIAHTRWLTWFGQTLSKLAGGAFGAGLDTNVAEAYTFIAEHYEEGDRIYLFGFSRGAYTVRALAAVLNSFGLLERGNMNLHPSMRELFLARRRSGDGTRRPNFDLFAKFKHTFARPVRVHFMGVWDTVASVGWITRPVSLPGTASNPIVERIRHAVAIDERRKTFRHNLFKPREGQDFKEVWFAGAHADVGGGYPEKESGLSKISLAWMLREAEAALLELKPERKRRILGGDGTGDYEPPSSMGPMHDPLKKPLWALLQWAPRRSFRMTGDQLRGYWDLSWRRRRRFMTRESVLHASVVERWSLDATYRPPNVGDIDEHPVEQ